MNVMVATGSRVFIPVGTILSVGQGALWDNINRSGESSSVGWHGLGRACNNMSY